MSGEFRPLIPPRRLTDRLVKGDPDTVIIEGAEKPQGNGGESATAPDGSQKERVYRFHEIRGLG